MMKLSSTITASLVCVCLHGSALAQGLAAGVRAGAVTVGLGAGPGGLALGLGAGGAGLSVGAGPSGVSIGGASVPGGGISVGGLGGLGGLGGGLGGLGGAGGAPGSAGSGGATPGSSVASLGGAAGVSGGSSVPTGLGAAVALPPRLLPRDIRPGRQRKLVLAKIEGVGTVRVTEESIRRGAVGPLPAVAGTPLPVVAACRQSIAAAALPYGAVHATAASAGAPRRVGSGLRAPIEMRIVYARQGAYEVRQSRVQCQVSGSGQVVAAL